MFWASWSEVNVATIPTFEAYRASASTALAAGVATSVDIPTGGSRSLSVSLLNGGSNPITAISITTIPVSVAGAARAVSTGLPLAAGSAMTITLVDEPCTTLRLTITSAVGSSATIEAVGL
jgi:DNA-binding IclR family transcriptional regulator